MYCIIYKYGKFRKINYFKKRLSLSTVYSNCGHEYKKIFKEEDSIEIPRLIKI